MLDQWRRERPEIDAEGMALIPRLLRLAYLYGSELTRLSGSFGLKSGWLDVLSALRRIGPPYRLSAGELARWVLLTSGGLTNRIDRMQEAGLVRRIADPSDRRGVLIELTARGREIIDVAIDAHLALYEELLAPLTKRERDGFVELMRKQTIAFERGEVGRART
jgi:DNA-binding MarR family transcriptional regulator